MNTTVCTDREDDDYKAWIESVKDTAKKLRLLNAQAVRSYTPIVNSIIAGSIAEEEIALAMDYILDFCWSAEMVRLFYRLCRGIEKEHPGLVERYLQYYQEMWGDS